MTKIKTKLLKDVTIQKENLGDWFSLIDKKVSDGDLFMYVRQIQNDGVQNGYNVTNLTKIYFWFKDQRDK